MVLPYEADIDPAGEIRSVAIGNRVQILDGQVTSREVEQRLRTEQFDWIHFGQHGNYNVLKFADGLMSQERLSRALGNQTDLRGVLLNACNSAGTAARIHNCCGIPVFAHEAPVGNAAAVTFAKEMYAALRDGRQPLDAFDDAEAVMTRTHPDAVPPVPINGTTASIRTLRAEVQGNMTQIRELREIVTELRGDFRRGVDETKRFMLVYIASAVLLMAVISAAFRFV